MTVDDAKDSLIFNVEAYDHVVKEGKNKSSLIFINRREVLRILTLLQLEPDVYLVKGRIEERERLKNLPFLKKFKFLFSKKGL